MGPLPNRLSRDECQWPARVRVIGAGGLVGSGVMQQLLASRTTGHIQATDVHQGPLQAHAIDLREALALDGIDDARIDVVRADDTSPADLVIVAASRPEDPQGDRRDFLTANWALLHQLAPQIEQSAGTDGAVLLLSNPVDILAGCLLRTTGLAPAQIVGYSLNDSLRFRLAVARELSVPAGRVEAYVLGEHGSGQVPLFSRIRVDGEPWTPDDIARERIARDSAEWFARWSALRPGRSSGWTTSRGVRAIVEAMAQGAVAPSSVCTGDESRPGTFLTQPSRLSPTGLASIEPWPLSDDEQAAMDAAAQAVHRSVTETLESTRTGSQPGLRSAHPAS